MTAPITDTCIFQGDKYALIAADNGRFISPAEFRMEPVMKSTACYSGFYATYEFNELSLNLVRLVITTKGGRYIPIDKITPKFDNQEHAWVYSGLCERILYTGKIRLGKWLDYWDEHHPAENVQIYAGYHGDRAARIFSTIFDISLTEN